MFKLIFTTTGQSFAIKVDMNKKQIRIKSQSTDYEWATKPWKYLYDDGIIWIEPPEGIGLKKIPLRFVDLERRTPGATYLRKHHELDDAKIRRLKEECRLNSLNEKELIDSMTEAQLKQKIIDKMLDIGYTLAKDESS